MQCVIIAAGKGTRMRPLTETIPKPLIEICGKPLLTHVVEALPSDIDELVLVVGYKAEMIKDYCGAEFLGRRMVYREQENFSGGTGDALKCAQDVVAGKFLFMYADDIHGSEALAAVVQEDHAMLAMESAHPEDFGVLQLNEDGTLKGIIEKPQNPPSNLVNISGFVLQPAIFNFEADVSKEHGELLVTDMITAYAQEYPIKVIEQDLWIPVGRPEDIKKAEALLCPERVESQG